MRYLLLIITVCLLPVTGIANESPPPSSLAKALQELVEDIPGYLYDVDALAERLDYDVQAAASFVRDEIDYDPYAGVLRGPAGTISTAAGSAWDQAVLTAALINSMGGEALLVRGKLADRDTRRLLLGGFRSSPTVAAPLSVQDVLNAVTPVMAHTSVDAMQQGLAGLSDKALDLSAIMDKLQRNVTRVLAEGGQPLAADHTGLLEELIAELGAEYVWVRYRDTPSDAWRDVHPAFARLDAPVVEPIEFLSDNVPEDRLHQIELQLEIERVQGGEVARVPIMKPYRRPVANLSAVHLPIGIMPSAMAQGAGQPDYFLPSVNGRLPQGAQAFTTMGLTLDASDAAAGPGVFGSVARLLGTGIGALDSGDVPRLSGVILTIEHIGPGGRDKQERRLLDFRDMQEVPQADAVRVELVMALLTGRENLARAQHRTYSGIGKVANAVPVMREAIDLAKAGQTEKLMSLDIDLPNDWQEVLLNGWQFEPVISEQTQWFRRSPVTLLQRIFRDDSGAALPSRIIDIVHQDLLAVKKEGDNGLAVNPSATLRLGIRQSLLENYWVGGVANLAAVKAAPDTLISNQAQIRQYASSIAATPAVRDRLNEDLGGENLLLYAETLKEPFWWRINPATGQALGRSRYGGAELTENAVSQIMTVNTLLHWKVGTAMCAKSYPNNAKMLSCCMAANTAMAGTFAAGGAVLMPAATSAAAGWGYIASSLTLEAAGTVTGYSPLGDMACSAIVE